MRTSREFIISISVPTISTSFDFHDLVKGKFSDGYRFLSDIYVDHYVLFLSRSLINFYTSPSMCHNA